MDGFGTTTTPTWAAEPERNSESLYGRNTWECDCKCQIYSSMSVVVLLRLRNWSIAPYSGVLCPHGDNGDTLISRLVINGSKVVAAQAPWQGCSLLSSQNYKVLQKLVRLNLQGEKITRIDNMYKHRRSLTCQVDDLEGIRKVEQ